MDKIQTLREKIFKEVNKIKNIKELEEAKVKFIGRKGEITRILRSLKDMPINKRIRISKDANVLKKEISEKIQKIAKRLAGNIMNQREESEAIDVSAPGAKIARGHLNPLTQAQREMVEIFSSIGFEVLEGPHIETEYYHFDALNIPENHPARDMWDTFWIKGAHKHGSSKKNLLLRAQTSSMQARYMEKHNPPFRIIVPGECFRYEATDASHDVQFRQLEGLMVGPRQGEGVINASHFKGVMHEFLKRLLGEKIKIKLFPSYFPFVEPGFELSINCMNCAGRGCSVCSKQGWLELMGAGMVHPNVFKAAGYNPKRWQGFAFGLGIERIAMMKYKISDIRLFRSGDLRFLNQF